MILGIAAIVVGLLFCTAGAIALRFVIAVWGAFVGFNLGAGLVAHFWDTGYLSTATGWVVGLVLAVGFAVIAYLYYAVAVLLATTSIGFALGAAFMGAVGVDWNWLVIVVAVLVGAILGFAAIVANLPRMLLVVLSSLGGASATVAGIMLVTGVLESADFEHSYVTEAIDQDWYWYALYLVLAIAGAVVQSRRFRAWDQQTWQA